MKIFLSWSGERGKVVAQALREWLPLVLHYAQPWFSDRDVEAGERWAIEIGRELEGSQFGVVVLTPESLGAGWVLFEAGALSKAFTAGAVVPYLVDLDFKDLTGPLAQFQAKKADKGGTLDLVSAINTRSDKAIEPARLAELFDALWTKLETKISSLPSPKSEQKPRAQSQVLEDLVTAVRRMEARLERIAPQDEMRSSKMVSVRVSGKFPDIGEDLQGLTFQAGDDFIEDIAGIAGVDVDSYGTEWHLTSRGNRRPISRESGKSLLKVAPGEPIYVVLRNGPA